MKKRWPLPMKIFVGYCMLTLGLIVENKAQFYTAREVESKAHEFDVFLNVYGHERKFFIPLVFWLNYNKDPHGLSFLLKTKNSHVSEVRLKKIKMISDDTEEEILVDKECSISSSNSAYYDFSGYSYGKIAKVQIPGIIRENKHIRIKISCMIYHEDRGPEAFDFEWKIEAKRRVQFSAGIIRLIQGIGASRAA